MLETQFFGKLLPTQPDIKPILLEIRDKYDIPEITPEDNGFKVLLKYHPEIDWTAVHAEILQRLKDHPDLMPPKTRKAYEAFKKFQRLGLVEPELKKLSTEVRHAIETMVGQFMQMYQPTVEKIDEVFKVLADHCLEFLLTGEAREIPQDWLAVVKTLVDSEGNKTIIAFASQLADPEKFTELFLAEYYKAFGYDRPTITQDDVNSADLLRMKWFGKSTDYLLEEEEKIDPARYLGKNSRRYPTAARKHYTRMRQKMHRLRTDLFKILK